MVELDVVLDAVGLEGAGAAGTAAPPLLPPQEGVQGPGPTMSDSGHDIIKILLILLSL